MFVSHFEFFLLNSQPNTKVYQTSKYLKIKAKIRVIAIELQKRNFIFHN